MPRLSGAFLFCLRIRDPQLEKLRTCSTSACANFNYSVPGAVLIGATAHGRHRRPQSRSQIQKIPQPPDNKPFTQPPKKLPNPHHSKITTDCNPGRKPHCTQNLENQKHADQASNHPNRHNPAPIHARANPTRPTPSSEKTKKCQTNPISNHAKSHPLNNIRPHFANSSSAWIFNRDHSSSFVSSTICSASERGTG